MAASLTKEQLRNELISHGVQPPVQSARYGILIDQTRGAGLFTTGFLFIVTGKRSSSNCMSNMWLLSYLSRATSLVMKSRKLLRYDYNFVFNH